VWFSIYHILGAAFWTEPIARAYEEFMNGTVLIKIILLNDSATLFGEIVDEAVNKLGLYDGYFTTPEVTGSVVEYGGFADLTPYALETQERRLDWADILPGYRNWNAQYEGKILLYPIDGDILSMFYRKDILEEFNLPVPRTWEEYVEVAAATHGKVFEGKKLVGSCVGRSVGCAGQYWANMVISTMTQTTGPSSGHLFDTADMTPLTGLVLEEALRLLELQAKYGPPDGTSDLGSE
jgi:multiple sugar transport system substrate-binding protein